MDIEKIPAPNTVEEVGIRRNLLEDLALKTVYLTGELSLDELGRHMGLALRIVEDLFQRLRKNQLVQVTGMAGAVHRIATTSTGNSRALDLLAHNQYAGPAPVPLEAYINRTRSQSVRTLEVTPDGLRKSFEHLVIESSILNQLGTAVVSGRTIFLYGPTGTGKTTIAETITRLFRNERIWLPHSVEVDGQFITIYDPVLHEKIVGATASGCDARWVLCRRPRVLVGGELTIEMLDLQFNSNTKTYAGPVQMKANNGLLIVDDFGRQRIRPEELLNRWVVPLDRRIDFLTLAGGKKIEIPFDLLVIFSTNIEPAKLADEAFLRRIQTKVKIGFSTSDQFSEIFRRLCLQYNLKYDESLVKELIRVIGSEYKQSLRACYPRDILQLILWQSHYLQQEPRLNRETLAQACRNYFVSL